MHIHKKYSLLLLTLLLALFLAACSSNQNTDPTPTMDHSNMDMSDRIPNENNSAVRIIGPNDGSVFEYGDQIIVEIETTNFPLDETGHHWHVYVDDESWGMVMGGNTTQPLNGVSKGSHMISVYLSNEEHLEYMEGDSIHVLVE